VSSHAGSPDPSRHPSEKWVRPANRIDVPDMGEGEPVKRYPVIAEYPGNICFHAKACWSTGRPEQCQMGYGMSS
jgi:hypothetical protein